MRNKKQVTMNLAAKKVKNHNVMFFRTDPEALVGARTDHHRCTATDGKKKLGNGQTAL